MANIETIGVKVLVEGADKAVGDLNRVNQAMSSMGGQAAATTSPLGFLASALGNVAQIAAGIISAQLINRLVEGLKDVATQAILGAARVDELQVILELLGARAGYSTSQLTEWRDAIKDAGIRTDVATELLAQFIRYQIDASEAVKLAAVAQDAATFAAQDSTEALAGLLHGILTQRSIVLRTYGIIVDMNEAFEAYGAIIGKNADDLDANERVQAALNAVLQQGTSIAGAYAAAMETPSKLLRTLSGRLIPELVWALGGPFQQAFHDAIFALSDFVTNLTVAVSEGGRLRPILDALAAAANRLLAPIVALSRVVSEWLGVTTQAANDVTKAVVDMATDASQAAAGVDLSSGFEDEAKKILQITQNLGKTITQLWEDYNRKLAQTAFDWNLDRLRDELDWQRERERDLAEHNRKMAELYEELRDLQTGKQRRDVKQRMRDERKTYQDQRKQLVELLGQAQSEEERLRITGWIDALDAEHKANQEELQEELDAIDEQKKLLEERIRMEEEAWQRRREQEEEDRRIRLQREEEDYQRRLAREEEATRLREDRAREAAAESIALVEEQIAEEQKARQQAYEQQLAALSTTVAEQRAILKGAVNEGKTLADQWAEAFQGLIPVIQEDLVPALDNLWKAWSAFYDEVWPVVKPILEWLAYDILKAVTKETEKLTTQLAWGTVAVMAARYAWGQWQSILTQVGTILGRLVTIAYEAVAGTYDVGARFVQGIVDGINGWWQHLIDRVRDLADAIMYEIKIALGIASPSKVFMGYGQEIAKGLAEGIRSMGDLPALQVGQMTLGALAAVPATSTSISNEWHLHTSSVAPVSTLHQDFHMMQVLAGR